WDRRALGLCETERHRIALIGRGHAALAHVLLAFEQELAGAVVLIADAHKIGLQGVAVRQLEPPLQRVLHVLPQLGATISRAAARLARFINGWRLYRLATEVHRIDQRAAMPLLGQAVINANSKAAHIDVDLGGPILADDARHPAGGFHSIEAAPALDL